MARGIFIALDGVDGAGKTTQCQRLVPWLRERGWAVTVCRDPGGTPVGDAIRRLLLGDRHDMTALCEMFLYMASRAQLVAAVVRPALERGEVVLSDRFLLANVVYQGHAGGLDPDRIWDVGRLATGGVLPDLTVVLDLPPDEAFARKDGPADRMESKGADYFAKVRAGFLAEAQRAPGRIAVVNAGQPPEQVQDDIRREVARVVGTRAGA
jgi:dTMP kinase